MKGPAKAALAGAVLLSPLALVLGLVVLFVAAVANGAAGHEEEAGAASSGSGPQAAAPAGVSGIGPVVLDAYVRAAAAMTSLRPKCKGMRWSVVAGIGRVESNHAAGRDVAANGAVTPRIYGVRLNGSGAGGNTSVHSDTDHGALDGDTVYDRAVGPMQFIPATWNGPSGQDGNGDGTKDPHNIYDAAQATAAYLCGTGTSDLADDAQLRRAVLRYNQSGAYADEVIGYVHTYDRLGTVGTGPLQFSGTGRGADALRRAAVHLGVPYSWGGGTPSGPSTGFCDGTNGYLNGRCSASVTAGFDCSSLVQNAYWLSLRLPRVASAQYSATAQHSVPRDSLQPGDLLFWSHGGTGGIYHVALYTGDGNVLHAPRTGKTVEIAPLTTAMPERDYYGATRP
ncbi:C40 family peptidase [Streptomyces filamentosus]|uniref:C40 family peptidase n=1 Tax=Streptomyces filamentosus TaxID=67294 RepID=UPI00331A6510